MSRTELKELAQELRCRIAQSPELDWHAARVSPAAPPRSSTSGAPGAGVSGSGVATLRTSSHSSMSKDGTRVTPAESAGTILPISPAEALAGLADEAKSCRRCRLGLSRIRPVFGAGDSCARVMFIGEGPGYEEDRRGEPFVGKAGELLDKILASIGLDRKGVYITNMVKCHPMADPSKPDLRGNDRPPSPEEIGSCRYFLERQIDVIRPSVIVTLGAVAAQALLKRSGGISYLRGKWYEYGGKGAAVRVLPTYHPAALLRKADLKRQVWQDMKSLRRELQNNTGRRHRKSDAK